MKEKQIGTTCVDSGSVVITDPCYLENGMNQNQVNELGKRLSNKKHTSLFEQINLGVVHRTRYGDGEYPIIATYDDDDMVVSIRVDFGSN